MHLSKLLVFIFSYTMTSDCLSLSGTITTDRSFYYEKFQTPPSKFATFEYRISFPLMNDDDYVNLFFYTTENHINIDHNCSVRTYAQVKYDHLHNEFKDHVHKACYRNGNILRCSQSRSIQDYKPRHFAFSFGFYCEHKLSKSLKGLWYNVSVYSQTNETICSTMPGNVPYCSKFYNQVSHPNLIDQKNREDAAKLFRSLFHTEWILGDVFDCYPYFLEAACYLFFPRCNTTSNSLTVPCRESWKQLGEACLETSNDLDNVVVALLSLKAKETVAAYDSEYLPSRFGPINCYYEDVFCGSPPKCYWCRDR